ncbi:abortive infection bacteriophage resistance protein [Planomicrobium soli]|uniref:Abortive infection bacteriophage resistance protein n=1 Tax=Planomicrobium soli TaxID=1176648 RepID=A0A2P8H5L6_9BACL|nr:Abi family protein [Planomicrobium soli]PSL41508.1 abortive infection bacteriophage resistance protein [Planomicrobium soli]
MKVFASHDEQIALLEKRGMAVPDKAAAKRILSRENYYALIDGYKEPFLERDERNNPYGLEQYRAGTEFGHIYALYRFDRELRMLLLNELLKFEKNIKSKIAYRFSEKFKEKDSFLESSNYSPDSHHHHERDRIISTLYNLIKSHKKRDRVRYPAIREFFDKHRNVPLWVLINFLSLGQIINFYRVIDEDLRARIAQDFAEEFSEEYWPIRLKASELDAILSVAFPYRNKSAHEEVLYRYRLDHPVELREVEAMMEMQKEDLNNGTVFSMVGLLKIVLAKEEYEFFSSELENLIKKLQETISGQAYKAIKKKIGFPEVYPSSEKGS